MVLARSHTRSTKPSWHPHKWGKLAAIVMAAFVAMSVRAQNVPDEYRLKAAFVYRFPQFVDWPSRALDGRNTIDLCVLAPSPFGSVLQELADGETLGGRALMVRQFDSAGPIDTCHLLFLPNASRVRRAVLQHVANLPILTVGDAPGFLDEGGIVQLRLVDKRVRFEINASAADRAGLRLSSQLLRLAVNIRGGPS